MKPSILHTEKYGKPTLIGLSVLLWLLIIALMFNIGYEKTWQLWRVPTEMPPFVDFRLIPGSAESFLRGYEPTVENPFDPRQRIFNYPTFWRIFFYSGITQGDAIWIGVAMLVLFFVAVFLFPEKLSPIDSLAMLFVLFSPASMLLYERGNVDLIVFFVCAINIVLLSYSPYLAAAGILFSAVMKIYPFLGISTLLKENRNRFLWLSGISTLLFVVYFFVTLETASVAWDRTMRGTEISYGANVLFDRYEVSIVRFLSPWLSDPKPLLQYGSIAFALSLIVIAGISALRRQQLLSSSSERNLAAFRMGASIYIGTFLLGNNWDYRLAFLIFTIPQLMEWRRSSEGKIRFISRLCLLCLILSCWHLMAWYAPTIHSNSLFVEITYLIDEVMNWTLMVTLAYLFAVSSPDWITADLKRFLPQKRLTTSP